VRFSTAEPSFEPATLVFHVSRVMTPLPGDMITPGTPAGIGPLQSGDDGEVAVKGGWLLRNPAP
jgi:2-keto-4-pentenoate hydratase/2-oxohepta-3-ene-1,7-dioic acid hydratase in catechol pathway